MSVPFSGTVKKSGGIASAIAKQQKLLNLKPVKKVVVKFDPFHENVRSTREFLYSLTGTDVLSTNLNCKIKTEVICNRSEPTITFTLNNNEAIMFKSQNLTNLELLVLFNKHITILAPKETPVTEIPQTKAGKKGKKR